MRTVGLVLFGGVGGLVASAIQLWWVGFGAVPASELALLCGAFAAVGLAIALAGDALGGIVRGRAGGWAPAGIVAVPLAFAIGIPFNLRGRPDLYLLVSDTTRADHLSLYGYPKPTTPFLEELAGSSFVFESAVSQGSHTLVSTPSILSSRYPSEHGMSRYSDVLPEDLELVSQHLQRAGYRSYGYATNPHLAPDRGFSRGFDTYAYDGRWQHASAASVNRHFLSWLDGGDGDPPVFAFLFYLEPHSPYAPPAELRRRFDPDPVGEPLARWPRGAPAPDPGSPQLRNLVSGYDGSIALFDAALRGLVAELEQRGRYANALIVYTSDHGEEFFEHGQWGHDRTLFEESIRVPLLVSIPSPLRFPRLARRSGRLETVVSSVDLMPTLLEAAGLPPDAGARGRSLLPLAEAGADGQKERFVYNEEILDSYGPYDLRGVRTRDHKYLRVLRSGAEGESRDLFFDLRADPGEQRNLLDEDPAAGAVHRGQLESMLREIEASEAPGNARVPIDPRRLEQLEALGYVGHQSP